MLDLPTPPNSPRDELSDSYDVESDDIETFDEDDWNIQVIENLLEEIVRLAEDETLGGGEVNRPIYIHNMGTRPYVLLNQCTAKPGDRVRAYVIDCRLKPLEGPMQKCDYIERRKKFNYTEWSSSLHESLAGYEDVLEMIRPMGFKKTSDGYVDLPLNGDYPPKVGGKLRQAVGEYAQRYLRYLNYKYGHRDDEASFVLGLNKVDGYSIRLSWFTASQFAPITSSQASVSPNTQEREDNAATLSTGHGANRKRSLSSSTDNSGKRVCYASAATV